MDCLLARIKRKRKDPFRKVISDQSVFDPFQLTDGAIVKYSADHNLDEDSWFGVEGFSAKDFFPEILGKDFDSKDYNDLEKNEFSEISFLMSVQGGNFYFQKLTPSMYVKRKLLAFGEIASLEDDASRIAINKIPDAVYFKDKDVLVFKNIASISSIFEGIDQLYREATKKETEDFLAEPFISLKDGFNADKVSKPNRKRLALAMDALSKMSPQHRTEMLDYVDGYCNHKLSYDNQLGVFDIKNDDELKLLLYGIEQRFYTTPFGQEKRLANSVQAV